MYSYPIGVLKRFGILPLDKMIECNADTLVGQFVGQTQQKVQDLLKDAEGGVLFVDEAHRLRSATGADAFKQEALGEYLSFECIPLTALQM